MRKFRASHEGHSYGRPVEEKLDLQKEWGKRLVIEMLLNLKREALKIRFQLKFRKKEKI